MRLEITRRADLAVRALAVISGRRNRIKGRELADRLDTTPSFLAQVVAPLVEAGWVDSNPGPTGGYARCADLTSVSVLDVIEAVEGETDTSRCVVADRPCDVEEPCALHHAWGTARASLLDNLRRSPIVERPSEVTR